MIKARLRHLRASMDRTTDASIRSADNGARQQAGIVGALVAPSLVALLFGVMSSARGPSEAHAAPTIDELVGATSRTEARSASPEQQEATAYCLEACQRIVSIASPAVVPLVGEGDDDEDAVATTADGVGKPQGTITSLMRDSAGQPAAFAGGRLLHEGDIFESGWVIEVIDLPSRTITLTHPRAEDALVLAPGR